MPTALNLAPLSRVRPAWPILNTGSTLARGLVSMFAAPCQQDLVHRSILKTNGAVNQRGWASVGGTGYQFDANDEGVQCNAPPSVQISYPITIAAHFILMGTPTANASLFDVTYNSTVSSPFIAYALGFDAAPHVVLNFNDGTNLQQAIGPILSAWTFYSVIATLATSSQILYVNNVSSATQTVATNIAYGTGPLQSAGENVAFTRNPNLIFYDGMIWNRILTANERWMLDYGSPWDLYRQPSRRLYVFQSSAAGYLLVKN